MKRKLLLVVLLLTGLALADQTPQQTGGVPQAQGQTGTAPGQPDAQAKPKAPQKRSAEAQAQATPGQAKKPQAETEAASGKAAGAQIDKDDKDAEPQAQTGDAPAQTDKDGKLTSVPGGKGLGMSVLGNQEAPKALVIVPWKSSDVGRAMGVSPMLDDSRLPVDKEVFMRELRYYEIKSQTKP